MCLKKLNKTMVLLIASMFLFLSPVLGYGFEGLGLNPEAVKKVSDSAMDDMRGKYYGFYFSINFTGYWDTIGSIPTAKLTYNAGLGKSNTSGSINIVGAQDNNSSTNNSYGGSDTVISSSSSSDASVSSSSNSSNGPAVKTTAVVSGDSLNGSGGVMQLTQVPGSQNFVYSGIVINLSIFNIKDTTSDNFRRVLSSMAGF